jgi:ABC-2 type transport system ATP-binding protein
MEPIATLEAVSKRYGRTVALQPTTLELRPGVVGLLGPNGAGKTTLLSLLATSSPPSAGRITVAGHPATGSHADRVRARRRLGYLPQEVVFPRGMTAFGFLDYLAVLKELRETATRHAEVQRVLELVQLGDLGSRKVSKLSGGQRRRLGIAQTLIGSPDLLVLDEPTTGLDPEQRASLRGLLSALPGTVLIATHQTEDVSALCDRVIVIDGGAIRFDGSVADLLASARDRVFVGPEPTAGAVTTWRTGTGLVHSVGGTPGPGAEVVIPSVEDAYLLLRGRDTEGVPS